MTTAQRPLVIAFDVVETLFPLEPLRPRFREAGLPEATVRHWFDRMLRDGFALAAAGGYRSFPDLATDVLREISGHQVPHATAVELVAAIATLDPRPDAEPALRRASAAGRAITITNGTATTTDTLLRRGGLREHVERVVSVEEVGRWKPAPDVYHHAATTCGVASDRMALVAAHGWDIHGAHRAGWVTGWSRHLEGEFSAAFAAADVTGSGLEEVVDALLALTE
ncbi:HAD-IA family hydrolase [Salinactinospora qingdaonensis]|uniref:Haloacid dehalogenase type II n=1 Tax=Salinactinospora qingdaonensis TaxID=702744 RepID=A0ABP7FB08_9ACTN